jgi:hypothetical protein
MKGDRLENVENQCLNLRLRGTSRKTSKKHMSLSTCRFNLVRSGDDETGVSCLNVSPALRDV